ncbi:unnamed protein product [Dovyalis caffra]|uniref:Uncharacterized protein n=1 Tax=Dovyalis caffra TaxID=77055 RepID=A0AAV1STZ1_9ROSI|nr:unnamed protein product [Dovyalis caffra]
MKPSWTLTCNPKPYRNKISTGCPNRRKELKARKQQKLLIHIGRLIIYPINTDDKRGSEFDDLETHSKSGSISIFVHYDGYKINKPKVISGYDVVLATYGVLTEAYKHNTLEDLYDLLCFLHVKPWYNLDMSFATQACIEDVVEAIHHINSATIRRLAPTLAYIEEVVEGIRREKMRVSICMESANDPLLTSCTHWIYGECLISCRRTPISGICPIRQTQLQGNDLITYQTESKFRVDVEND